MSSTNATDEEQAVEQHEVIVDTHPSPDEVASANPRSRKTLFLLIGLAALLMFAAAGVTWYLSQPQVTDVSGKTKEQAITSLESDGFVVGEITYDENAEGAQGSVASQEPEAGKRVKAGTMVVLTIAGPPPVPAPDVTGKDATEAGAVLEAAGLVLGPVTESYHESVLAGLVISQDREAGVDAPRGSKVAIVVSKGPEPVAIPSVAGAQEADAVGALEAAGFTVTVVAQDNAAAKGTVLDQSPAAGALMVPGTAVTLTVSTGVDLVRVPNALDFRGSYHGDDFTQVLESHKRAIEVGFRNAGLVADVEFTNGWDDGPETRQSPKAGSMVPRGTRVSVIVPTYN